MNAPATPEQSNSPFDMTKIKTTAILFTIVGCLILPVGIVNFIHARPYFFAAPFFCIALAITLFTRKPKAIPYIFVANLVLESFRLIYHFANCFWQYAIDENGMGVCISLTISCLLLIISTICAVYWLFTRKSIATESDSASGAVYLLGFSYIVSEISYIIQMAQTANEGAYAYALPIDIIIVIFNAVIGVMMSKSINDMFNFLPDLEQIAQEEAAKRAKQQPAVYRPVAVPAPTPVVQPRVPVNVTDEIMKYKQLLDMGAITQEEYDQKKTELLHTNS